jgi:hypothetical protein
VFGRRDGHGGLFLLSVRLLADTFGHYELVPNFDRNESYLYLDIFN